MLAHWDPFSEIARLQDRFFTRGTEHEWSFRPAVDIYEDDKGIHVKAEVPGVQPEDIKIDVENRVLTLSGERKLEHEDNAEGYRRVERYYGTFSRSFALPNDVSAEEIDAKCKDGVLTVTLPKRPEAKRRQISVKAA